MWIYCPPNQFKDFAFERCQPCPEGGICVNGQLFNKAGAFFFFLLELKLKLGYWRENNVSSWLYLCTPQTDACMESQNNHLQICVPNYVGPLCQTCEIGFSKYGGKECMLCYPRQTNLVLIIFLTFILTIFVSLYIKYPNFIFFN